MATGVVKWFNNIKGFGFIVPDDGGDDLFAHYTSINAEGFRTIKAGQLVSFDIETGDKGPHAKNISVVDNVFPVTKPNLEDTRPVEKNHDSAYEESL